MATIDYIIDPPATTGSGTVYTSNNPYIATNSDFRRWLGSAQVYSQEDLELAKDALLFYGKPVQGAVLPSRVTLREMVAMQEESLRKSAELQARWREQQEQLQAAAAAAKAKADALAKLSPGQRRMANLLWETPP